MSTSRDRGAAAVEFALILPLFVLLVFGVVGAARLLSQKMSLTHAANEGARFGATYPTPNDPTLIDSWLAQVAQVTVAAADGDLAVGVPARSTCVAYHNGETGTDRRLMDGVSASSLCFDDGRPSAESRVQVAVARQSQWDMALIPAWTVGLGSRAVSRYEVVAVPTPSPTSTP